MNILITGCNGFLGREFVRLLVNTGHSIICTARDKLDVANEKSVEDFFNEHDVDIVLHTAIKGGRRNHEDCFDDFLENIKMYKNLEKQSDKFKLMFTFCSGAAFDRTKPVDNISEEELLNRIPADYYGLSKNLIAREVLKHNSNIVNLRLFGCFGPNEAEDRFIRNSMSRGLKGESILIHQNKEMDFFYISDLAKVVLHYIENYDDSLPKDLNMTYESKTSLMEIASIIKDLTGAPIDVILRKNDASPYTGDSAKLSSLGIAMSGLSKGIEEVYNKHVR
tara:strand:+ start:180 stop:1016 length:837 start_codon:yes stop_codon:yes gene_type:complete